MLLPKTNKWKTVKSQLRLPWASIFLVISVICLIIFLFSGGNDEVREFYEKMHLMEVGEENAFIHNAYFYSNSKS